MPHLPHRHYSFGDKADAQLPHMVMPLWASADHLIITPAGETPPTLGYPLDEPSDVRARRRSRPAQWELGVTYTFSWYSALTD